MSDLPSGSTIGGKLIVHKGIAHKHRHHVSEIDGLSDQYQSNQGDGGGIDADVLSDKSLADLNDEFISKSNDAISTLILANEPTQDDHATSKLYVSTRASQGFANGDFYGLTSIGTVNDEIPYVVVNQYIVRILETDMMVNGWQGVLPEHNIDIRDITPNYQNKSLYLFVESDSNSFVIEGYESKALNAPNKIFIAEVVTDGTGIVDVNFITGVSRFGIERYMLSETPDVDRIVISKDTGLIDDGWIVGSKGETSTFLDGPTQSISEQTLTYDITNYNSFSTYAVSGSVSDLGVSIADDVITVTTPTIVPTQVVEQIIIERDGFAHTFDITLLADPAPTLSGPLNIQSGNTFVYTIGDYKPQYTYSVSTDIEGLFIERSDDQVTVYTDPTNPYTQSGYIEIAHEGSSTQEPVTFDADPEITLSGPDLVSPNDSFVFSIGNYNDEYSYTVSSTLGTVTRSGSNVILDTSTIPQSEESQNMTIEVSREGSTATFETFYQKTFVLNSPEDFDPNVGTTISFGELFSSKYGIGSGPWYAIDLPDGVYEINIHPREGTDIIYASENLGDGGSHGMVLDFSSFSDTSEVTVNFNGKIVGQGGEAGGDYDFNKDTQGVPSSPKDGGSGVYVQTRWNSRTVPITLDFSNAELYGGGGGGYSAYHIVVSSDSRNSNYVKPDGSFVYVREGFVTGATGGKSAFSVPDGKSYPLQTRDSSHPISTQNYEFAYTVNPTYSNEGRVRFRGDDLRQSEVRNWYVYHGGIGGDVGQASTRPFTFSYDDAEGEHRVRDFYSSRGYYANGNTSSSSSVGGPDYSYGGKPYEFNNDDTDGYIVIE